MSDYDNEDIGEPLADVIIPEGEEMLDDLAADRGRPEDMESTEKANLASVMTEDELKAFARRCIDRYERDLASRAPRMKRLKELQEMYSMVTKTKSFPFQKAANVCTPTVAGPNLQIQARLYDMIIPASGEIFHVIPGTPAEHEIVIVAEHFGNTYLRYHMPYFVEGMDDTLHQVSLYGSSFKRTYGDTAMRKVRSDWIPIENFVVAWGHRSQDPSMSDVPFYTYIHDLTVEDIKAFGEGLDAVFINTDKISEEVNTRGQESEFKTAADKIDGVDADDEFQPHQVLECHCRYKLPKASARHPSFDGKAHYLVVHIDWPSEKVLRISLREEDDPDDARRYDRDAQKFQQFIQGMEAREAAIMLAEQAQMQYGTADPGIGPPPPGIPPIGGMPPEGMPMPPMGGPSMPPPPPPIPPEPPPPFGMDETGVPAQPRPVRRRQITFFTHYRCFPSDGFYGLGYGDILYGLALAKNTVINQHIDGVTLRNAKPMFISNQVRIPRGNLNVQPGQPIMVDGPINQIRDAIMFMDPPSNDPTTVPLIKMLDGMSDILAGSADMMSGQMPGSNQAAESIRILSEHATMPITVLGRRLMNCFKHELYKIWRCFGVFLDDDEIKELVADPENPISEQVGKAMFSPSARLVPASDPRTKAQRLQEFQQLVAFLDSSPMTSPKMNKGVARQLALTGLKLFPDGPKFVQYLPPEQPPKPPPPPPKPHWEEEAQWLSDEDPPVHPADDDAEHMQGHMAMLSSPAAQMMTKVQRDKAERHNRFHAAAQIRKEMSQGGQVPAAAGPPQGPQGPPPGPPGPPPGGPGGPPPEIRGPNGGGPGPMERPPGIPPFS